FLKNTVMLHPLVGRMYFSDNSDVSLSPSSILPFLISGPGNGEYSQLDTFWTMQLAGTLSAVLSNSVTLLDGMSFRVMNWRNKRGSFSGPATGYFALRNDLIV